MVRLLLFMILLVGCAPTGDKKEESFTTVFSDNFDRTDGDPGDKWFTVNNAGTFLISSNKFKPLAALGQTPPIGYYSGSQTAKDKAARISVDGSFTGGTYNNTNGPIYLIARTTTAADRKNAYVCGLSSKYLVLGKFVDNVYHTLGASTNTFSTSDTATFTLVFTLTGTSLVCEITTKDSSASLSATDSSFANGYNGVSGGSNDTPYLFFDNFTIGEK